MHCCMCKSRRLARISRGLWGFAFTMVMAAIGLIVQFEMTAAELNSMSDDELFVSRRAKVPNAEHVWWASDLFATTDAGVLCLGVDYLKDEGNWSVLCWEDTNKDGLTNGQHLGDPCCHWRPPNKYFDLPAQREYRRWHLSHPAEKTAIALAHMGEHLKLADEPITCDEAYNVSRYNEQFQKFYFYKSDGEISPTNINLLKFACLFAICAVLGHWIVRGQLLSDLIPWSSSKALPSRLRISLCLVSFFYMDLTSGVIHLILDYAPHTLPGLGILAKGFQFHHYDPTAIIRISWYEYVSHIHFLVPVIQLAVVLSDASRAQRFFWFSGGIWAHLFQTAHRWAHMPPASLPWIVRAWQSSGLLLSHRTHMSHHEDLQRQFTILSGHTDVILDNLSSIVPPARYDWWFLFGVFWFLCPIFADTIFRDVVRDLQGFGAVAKSEKIEVYSA